METGEGCCSTGIVQLCTVSLFLVEAILLGSVSCGKILQSLITPPPAVNTAFAAWLLDATSLSAAALRPALQAEHLQFQTPFYGRIP